MWEDIESAPRDGSNFPALWRGELIIARWSATMEQFVGVNVADHEGRQTVSLLANQWADIPGPTKWLRIELLVE